MFDDLIKKKFYFHGDEHVICCPTCHKCVSNCPVATKCFYEGSIRIYKNFNRYNVCLNYSLWEPKDIHEKKI